MGEENQPVAATHIELRSFCVACFEKLGLVSADAEITADNLVFANLRGVDSHGVIRLKVYADRIRAGGIDPAARPEVVRESATSALIDAHNGAGQVAGAAAMRLAIKKANEAGLGLVTVRGSNHFGAAGYYAMMALEREMIGIAVTNATPTMAPTGGREARLGNNPLAIAVPAGVHAPLVLDMASGAVAKGKIFVAKQEGKKIPLTWALDRNGLPTDDPDAAIDGGLIQPLGGYKGYGLSLVIDILTGVMSGSGFSVHVGKMYQNIAEPTHTAHTCMAIRIDSFMDPGEFRERVDEIIELMRACPPAPGADRVFVPGEIEDEVERQRREAGIPINAALREELRALAAELQIEPPF